MHNMQSNNAYYALAPKHAFSKTRDVGLQSKGRG